LSIIITLAVHPIASTVALSEPPSPLAVPPIASPNILKRGALLGGFAFSL